MARAVRWALADLSVTSSDGVTLSNGSATLVARGRVVFLRVFVGDKATASRLQARSERACRPSRRRMLRDFRGDDAGRGAVR